MKLSDYLLSFLGSGMGEFSFTYQILALALIVLWGCVVYLVMHYIIANVVRSSYVTLLRINADGIAKKVLRILLSVEEKKVTNSSNRVKSKSIMEILCYMASFVSMDLLFPILFPTEGVLVSVSRKIVLVCIIFIGYLIARKICNALHYQVTEKDEIKGANLNSMMQMIKLSIACATIILSLSVILGMNVYLIVTGLGAFAAVLMLVFKDSIVGLVAGIQLIQNDMVKKGDWITMRKHNVDGVVESINLTTVKVRNFDDTIITVPPYALVGDSFQNWKGMNEEGVRGRRVKRVIPIDMDSIKFLTDEEIMELPIEKERIDDILSDETTNVKTNLTFFRAYLNDYISTVNSCNTHKHAYHFIRLLNANEHGLPLEIYYYSNLIEKENWPLFENEQSKMVEFCLASLRQFGLRPLQCKIMG